jgi:hypothetical protein
MPMAVRRYERELEESPAGSPLDAGELIPLSLVESRLAASGLSAGARDLVRGLCRLARPKNFPGGGVGIEYGALLKTAINPAYLHRHAREAAEHLRERRADVLIVPGMSGYPVGSVYSAVSEIPAILLKKQRVGDGVAYPDGSFILSSYTGSGEHVMSADPHAVQDIVDVLLEGQLRAQDGAATLSLSLRLAGADDIVDKGIMSQAVSDSGIALGRRAVERFLAGHRRRTGDARVASVRVEMVAWVTPLIKGYNRPQQHLARLFGITPFAGLDLTGVHLDPPAIGVAGLGTIAFAEQ